MAAARLGRRTVLISHDPARIGALSCNPAVGGLGKGHLVREVDALGGLMGRAADAAGIQFRRLNMRKGPAVRASRVQVDRPIYRRFVQGALRNVPHLTVLGGEADRFRFRDGRLAGVVLTDGREVGSEAVVVTTGTFLGGAIHVGTISFPAGRLGDRPALGLSEALAELGLEMGRLKTGTPPRIYRNTIDFSELLVQSGDRDRLPFSILTDRLPEKQTVCHITRTRTRTQEIVRAALDRSSLYGGRIKGISTRYCPSFEDKVVKFPDKETHQVFLEPEGLNAAEVYPNGMSNSLPLNVQEDMIRSLKGLERAVLARPGYAIEYDYVQPTELGPDLGVKGVPGLFLAGQINGTSGYEEAAAQGLWAGLGAARRVAGESPLAITRERAYLGVMIDDLTTRGADEPYRMFTSRAEYRLLLREDNAAERLTPWGRELGLIGDDQWRRFEARLAAREKAGQVMAEYKVRPTEPVNRLLAELGGGPLREPVRLAELLKRPKLSFRELVGLLDERPDLDQEAAQDLEVAIKYAGYVAKQEEEVRRFRAMEERLIPDWVDYSSLDGLSTEVVEKLNRVRPRSLGQAARIPGVTPAAVMLIAVKMKSGRRAAPDQPADALEEAF